MPSASSASFHRLWQSLFRVPLTTPWDWVGPLCIVCLAVTGVFFIYSAQAFVESNNWLMQLAWLGLGAGVYFLVGRIDYHFYLRNAVFIYLAGIILLLLVWSPLGDAREGARRWLDLKVASYQPAEAAKLSSLILAASILARSSLGGWKDTLWLLVKVAAVSLPPMLLIFMQPDLGSSLVIPPMILSLLYVARVSSRFFIAMLGLVLVLGTLVAVDLQGYKEYLIRTGLTAYEARGQYETQSAFPMRDYQRERLLQFVAPEVVDPHGTGAAWNSNQAQLAVSTGGLVGKGWRQGLQAQLGYLPRSVAHNDFIFAVLAEEIGFIGGVFVIGLYALLLGNGVRIAALARDRFGMLLCVGITVILLVHVFINIGMSIGVTPITGLPLPFVSYGGSFILSCCVFQGIIQSVYRHRKARV